MLPAADVCETARRSRDPRFDGRFFVGVLTTGVYCRPVCPAPVADAGNVRYFASAAAAQEAGYRPCRRCRPEAAAGIPEWHIRSRTVLQGLRLIESGFLDTRPVTALATRLGVTARHLNRLFHQELGATAKGVAMARRRGLAKRLLDETRMPVAEVALAAGYGSLRRCNDDFQRAYGGSPRQQRDRTRRPAADTAAAPRAVSLALPVRPPYNADWMFDFLGRRALTGFEVVTADSYRRRVADQPAGAAAAGGACWITVERDGHGLRLQVPEDCPTPLGDVLLRVRRLFDLDADSATVDAHLGRDLLLAPAVATAPGLRVPGAWDGFETAVRAVLGQQVSVARGTMLAERLLQEFGQNALCSPEVLARADPASLGMPRQRGEAIRRLADEVAGGRLDLDDGADWEPLQQALCAIPGIGPWTAGYVAMRVQKDPDALPAGDWVVAKMLGAAAAAGGRCPARAAGWRPWRAYAVMYLWKMAAAQGAVRKTPPPRLPGGLVAGKGQEQRR